ncbi:MAG TPA: hypothetical protein VK891_02645, partial [Euzebyales bacterium]|nr:hypothetical protein [Euzebyales bacterium]
MADAPTTHADHVARGRTAAEHRAWGDAFTAFAAADADAAPLEPGDLQLWAIAAYLIGHVDTAVDALARAFHAHHDDGNPAAAVRCGFWIFFMLTARGDVALAGGWQTRCERLLASLPAGAAEHGYLLCSAAFRLATV